MPRGSLDSVADAVERALTKVRLELTRIHTQSWWLGSTTAATIGGSTGAYSHKAVHPREWRGLRLACNVTTGSVGETVVATLNNAGTAVYSATCTLTAGTGWLATEDRTENNSGARLQDELTSWNIVVTNTLATGVVADVTVEVEYEEFVRPLR